jgi:hypothetical protein
MNRRQMLAMVLPTVASAQVVTEHFDQWSIPDGVREMPHFVTGQEYENDNFTLQPLVVDGKLNIVVTSHRDDCNMAIIETFYRQVTKLTADSDAIELLLHQLHQTSVLTIYNGLAVMGDPMPVALEDVASFHVRLLSTSTEQTLYP